MASAVDLALAAAEKRFIAEDRVGALEYACSILARDRSVAGAYALLARIGLAEGATEEARPFREMAIRADRGEIIPRAQFAWSLVKLSERMAAADVALAALGLAGDRAETFRLIGAALHLAGDYSGASDALHRAVLAAPESAATHFDLGAALVRCGQIDDAVAAFERAVAIDPAATRALAALSELRPATSEQNNIALIERALADNHDPHSAISLHHALSRELEHIGQHQSAFAALEMGKRALSAAMDRASDADIGLFDALDAIAARSSKISGYLPAQPIFIVGMPRCGSALAERILLNSEQLVSIGESQQLGQIVRRHIRSTSSYYVDGQALLNAWPALDMAMIGEEYTSLSSARTRTSSRTVDRLPLNFLLIDLILASLPEARIVWMSRDPLDTVISNFRHMFDYRTGTYDYSFTLAGAARFTARAATMLTRVKERYPDRVHEVRYENLVEDPKRAGSRMMRFCGLLANAETEFSGINRGDPRLRDPVHGGFVGRWRSYQAELAQAGLLRD